jgi:adenylyltransferase/sulfurtransferase
VNAVSPKAKASARKLSRLSESELIRYARHLVLPEVGEKGQRKLKASSVLVVGVGGLGIPAATYLTAAGVGRIGLVDDDVIEMSNLQRQFLFSESDIGENKAAIARSRLLRVNPGIEVVSFQVRLDSSNAMDVVRGFDVVVDCTDNLPSRYLINDACVLLGKPDVYASALGFDGQASVFDANRGPCYRCLYPLPPPPDAVKSCEEAGVLGVVPGIMGGVQAVQAISILLGKGSPLVGRLLVFSGLDSSFDEVRFKRNPGCPVCGPKPTIRELVDYEEFCGARGPPTPYETTPLELKESIRRGGRPLLLDVREPYEHEICSMGGSRLIPLGQLRERMNELDRSRPIVVYCHHGDRSARAVKLLRMAGYKATNLTGGIEAWRMQVDPGMRRY